MLSFDKKDKFGHVLKPGYVVVCHHYKKGLRFAVYKEPAGGSMSKGTYGRFVSTDGVISVKYDSVVFVFDSLYEQKAKGKEVKQVIRSYYEGAR